MKVKNVGGKIVSIGVTAILPGETAQATATPRIPPLSA